MGPQDRAHDGERGQSRQCGHGEPIVRAVAVAGRYRTWRAFGNQYWPAAYLIDRSGTIVATQFGEGGYQQMESAIARLVGDREPIAPTRDPDLSAVATPEIYLGSEKNEGALVETQDAARGERTYALPDNLEPNRFALSGLWNVTDDGELRESAQVRRRREHAQAIITDRIPPDLEACQAAHVG